MRPTAVGKKGFGPDGPQPPARGQCFKKFVSRVGATIFPALFRVLETVVKAFT